MVGFSRLDKVFFSFLFCKNYTTNKNKYIYSQTPWESEVGFLIAVYQELLLLHAAECCNPIINQYLTITDDPEFCIETTLFCFSSAAFRTIEIK